MKQEKSQRIGGLELRQLQRVAVVCPEVFLDQPGLRDQPWLPADDGMRQLSHPRIETRKLQRDVPPFRRQRIHNLNRGVVTERLQTAVALVPNIVRIAQAHAEIIERVAEHWRVDP